MEPLARNPQPEGCGKLQGAANLGRIRIGDYRVLYAVDDPQRLADAIIVLGDA